MAPFDQESHAFKKPGFQGLETLETLPAHPPFEAKQDGLANLNLGGRSKDVSNKPAKPRRSGPTSICQQTGFLSPVVSGLFPSMELPVHKGRQHITSTDEKDLETPKGPLLVVSVNSYGI